MHHHNHSQDEFSGSRSGRMDYQRSPTNRSRTTSYDFHSLRSGHGTPMSGTSRELTPQGYRSSKLSSDKTDLAQSTQFKHNLQAKQAHARFQDHEKAISQLQKFVQSLKDIKEQEKSAKQTVGTFEYEADLGFGLYQTQKDQGQYLRQDHEEDEEGRAARPGNVEVRPESPLLTTELVSESLQDMAVRDLLEECQTHFRAINTFVILQQVVKDELMKQVKLDNVVAQKLTTKIQRLQQQLDYLEQDQSPQWVKATLGDLVSGVSLRADVHKKQCGSLTEQCDVIQRSLDDYKEIMTSLPVVTRQSDTEDDQPEPTNVPPVATSDPKKPELVPAEAKPPEQEMTFIQANVAFEEIRRPWMKLVSLKDYQQEQFDHTAGRIKQVEAEINDLPRNEDTESKAWKTQMDKKDLTTKRELLEARLEHLDSELQSALKDLSTFEQTNRERVLLVLDSLRQHRIKCDGKLRQSLQLLKSATLRDPTCLRCNCQKFTDGDRLEERTTSTSLPSRDSWSGLQAPRDEDAFYARGEANSRRRGSALLDMSKNSESFPVNASDSRPTAGKYDFSQENKFQTRDKSVPRIALSFEQDVALNNRRPKNKPPEYEYQQDKSYHAFKSRVSALSSSFRTSSDLSESRRIRDRELSLLEMDESANKALKREENTTFQNNYGGCQVRNNCSQTDQPVQISKAAPRRQLESEGRQGEVAQSDGEQHCLWYKSGGCCYDRGIKHSSLKATGDFQTQEALPESRQREHTSSERTGLLSGRLYKEVAKKDRRVSYFIYKYAGGKNGKRTHLLRSVPVVRPLALCSVYRGSETEDGFHSPPVRDRGATFCQLLTTIDADMDEDVCQGSVVHADYLLREEIEGNYQVRKSRSETKM